jgi:hypothetical protein
LYANCFFAQSQSNYATGKINLTYNGTQKLFYSVTQPPFNRPQITAGSGIGHAYIAPSGSTGTPGQIGERILFQGLTFKNESTIREKMTNSSCNITTSCVYSMNPSQVTPN